MKSPLYAFTALAVAAVALSGCYDLTSSDLQREQLGEDPAISAFHVTRVSPHEDDLAVAEGGEGLLRITGLISRLWGCGKHSAYVVRGDDELHFQIEFDVPTGVSGGCAAGIRPRSAAYEGVLGDLAPGTYRIRVSHDLLLYGHPGEWQQVLDTIVEVGCCYDPAPDPPGPQPEELAFSAWHTEVVSGQAQTAALEAGAGSIAVTGRIRGDRCEPVEGRAELTGNELRIEIHSSRWNAAVDPPCPDGGVVTHRYEGMIADVPPGDYQVSVRHHSTMLGGPFEGATTVYMPMPDTVLTVH